MIYVLDRLDEMTEADFRFGLSILPQERQKKARYYQSTPDQYACVLSYLLLCYGLCVEYGITETIYFRYNSYGKPYSRDYPHVYFNISHCRCGVACAISDRETGVDIQDIRQKPVRESLAKRVLSASEYSAWKKSKSPDRLFYRYWTMKESYLKQKGTGIQESMSALDAEGLDSLPEAYAFYMEKEMYCLSAFGVKDAKVRIVTCAELFA